MCAISGSNAGYTIRKGMQLNTTMSVKVYLMAILDSYVFRPLLAIFRLSSRERKSPTIYIERARGVEISTYLHHVRAQCI